jgi:hypothetical protein
VSLYNKFQFKSLKFQFKSLKKDASYGDPELVECYDDLTARLGEIFPQEQQHLIESAFELTNMSNGPGRTQLPHESIDAAINFGAAYDVPKARLRAIMKNIVKNDGEFRP